MKTRWCSCLLASFCYLALFSAWTASADPMADSTAVKALFANPPRAFSSAPLWVWNDLLTEQQVVETLRDLASQKVKQVFVHPRPGLMTPYLSADWFRLWKAALAEAEKLDMNLWIYDENSYPSGFAGGLVPEAMPESRGRGLAIREVQTLQWNTNVVAIFRVAGEKAEDITQQVRSRAALPSGGKYVVASVQRAPNSPWHGGRCYVDLLYPGVTEKFLDLTLETYRREIGQQFGKRVPGMFTDEPNIRPAGGLPWTDDLLQQFQKRWGYDLKPSLPSLQFESGDWQRIRHNYYSLLNELFIERWAKPYRDRCQKLGLEMTGHYWEHDWPNCVGVPDNMAMYAWEQRPAIDCLMNQYAENTHAQFGNARMVRELGSIANQLGKARTLSEVYGAGGWDLRFEDMKRQADWLGVLGVNTFDQHLSYVTIRGARKRDHPQSFSYHEPWWDSYNACGSYLERLSVAVSQGEQLNHVLVIEPTTSAWMYQGNEARLKELGDSFFKLVMALESAQVEYDLGCEDVMARYGQNWIRYGPVNHPFLTVGQRLYDTVVVPPLCENLNSRTWDLLNQFAANGGTVISCVRALPRKDGSVAPADPALAAWFSRAQQAEATAVPSLLLAQARDDGFLINRKPEDKGILFHMRRQLDDGDLLLLVNTSIDAPSSGSLQTRMHGVESWDLESGRVSQYPFRPAEPKGVQADFELPPCGSLLLFLSKEPREPGPQASTNYSQLGPASALEIKRTEPNVLTLDYVDITAGGETRTNLYFYQANQFAFQKNGMERNPWDSAVQFKDELIRKKFPANSGFQATYRFKIEDKLPTKLAIVIERPDLYAITFNGQPVRPTPGAWWLDKSFGRIDLTSGARLGDNEVKLEASPFTVFHELEPAYVLGNFAVAPSASGFVLAGDHPLTLGRWNEQGQPFYAAGVSYSQRFNVGDVPMGEFFVKLPDWRGSVAKVLVNGNVAGYIGHAPWECNVTHQIWNGENTIEVIVVGTLKNTLGPHHGKPPLGTAWPGSFQRAPIPGPPPARDYDTVGYGLFQPFVVRQLTQQQ